MTSKTPIPIVFAHGMESSPQGTKAVLLSQRFGALAVDLRGLILQEQSARIAELLRAVPRTVLVGSSLGGLAVLGAARVVPERIAHLILLAPAVGAERNIELFVHAEQERPGLRAEVAACRDWSIPPTVPATVLHGLEDDVVETSDVLSLVQRSSSARLLLVHDGHQLSDHLELLAAMVERAASGREPSPILLMS